MSVPDPGWYPDPAAPDTLARWWDGSSWSDRTRPRHDVGTEVSGASDPPSPGPGSPDPQPAATGTARPAATTPSGPPPRGPRPEPGLTSVRRARSARTGIVLVTALVALTLAVVTVASVLHREPTPRAEASVAPPAPGRGGLEMATRVAVLDGVRLQLPDTPYQIDPRPVSIAGLFEACYLANALVHPAYDGEHDWVSTVGLISLPAGTDTDRLARTTLEGVHRHFFGGARVTAGPVMTAHGELDGHAVTVITQDVEYAIPRLPSTGDRITLKILGVGPGRHVAALSVVPHDAPTALRRAAESSLDSMAMA